MTDAHEPATDAGELPPQLVRTIEHLTARWARADTAILKHVFPLLGEGRPVSLDRLAKSSGTTTDIAAQAVASGRVTLDGVEPREVVPVAGGIVAVRIPTASVQAALETLAEPSRSK